MRTTVADHPRRHAVEYALTLARPDLGTKQAQRHGQQPVVEVSQYDIVSSAGGIVVEYDGPVMVREGVFQPLFAGRPASAQSGHGEHFNARLLAVGVVQGHAREWRLPVPVPCGLYQTLLRLSC